MFFDEIRVPGETVLTVGGLTVQSNVTVAGIEVMDQDIGLGAVAITSIPLDDLGFSGVLGLAIGESGDVEDDDEDNRSRDTSPVAQFWRDVHTLPDTTNFADGEAKSWLGALRGSTGAKRGFSLALARQNSGAPSWLGFDCLPEVRHGPWDGAPFEAPLSEGFNQVITYTYVVKPSRVVLIHPRTGHVTKIDLSDVGDPESATPMGIGSAYPFIRLPSGKAPILTVVKLVPRSRD